MRAKRIIISAIATLCATTANAAPVTVSMSVWNFGVSVYAHSPNDGGGQDSSVSFSNRAQLTLEEIATDPAGQALARGAATMTTSQTADDDSFSLYGTATGEAFAAVDAGVPGGTAYAYAGLGKWLVQFEVLEPVLYTGTESLFNGTVDPRGSSGTTEYLSGSILQAGTYSRRIIGTLANASAAVGQSDYDQITQNFAMSFTRVPVPEPGSLALMLLGVAGIASTRRKAQARS